MEEEGFKNKFLEFSRKIPYLKGARLSSVNFCIIYPRRRGVAKDVFSARYEIEGNHVECLIQSPKDVVLENVDRSKLKYMKIGNNKFYTDYDPKLNHFPSRYVPLEEGHRLYTLINNNVLTIATDDKNCLKLVKKNRFMKPELRIFELIKNIPEQIGDFAMCFIYYETEIYDEHYMFILISDAEKEVRVEYYKDNEGIINSITDNFKNFKKIDNLTTIGKIEDKLNSLYKINKNTILVLKLIKGTKNDLLGLVPKLKKCFK